MKAINVQRGSWKTVLRRQGPLLLPAAHDALSARLIERTGFKAYQIGGFALAGSAHAVPDVGLDDFGEKAPLVRQIINASPLPVLVDADDGYGDAKSVTRTSANMKRWVSRPFSSKTRQRQKSAGIWRARK